MPFDFLTGMYTGTATYAIFEAKNIAALHSSYDWFSEENAYGWWVDEEVQLQLMREGRATFIDIGMDGAFLFRITDEPLSLEEEQRVLQIEKHIWLEVDGSSVIFGAAEALPVHPDHPEEFVEEFGMRFAIEPGRYHLTVYRLIGSHDDEEEESEEEELPFQDLRIPAYIVQFRPFVDGDVPPTRERRPVLSFWTETNCDLTAFLS